MTKEEHIAQWRQGAKDSLHAAKLLQKDGLHALALFHCHLAAEKCLKAQYVEEVGKNPPPTHELLYLAENLQKKWSGDVALFEILGHFAVEARYHDKQWVEKNATIEQSHYWIDQVSSLLFELCP